MKKFTYKIGLILLVVLLLFSLLEFLVFPFNKNSYSDKYDLLKDTNTEVIIGGNSHLRFGIVADSIEYPSINIANKGRELEVDVAILTKENLADKKNLKAIIIPISYYTLFKEMNNSEYFESQKRLYYQYYHIEKYSQGFIKNRLIVNEPYRELLDDSFLLPFNNKSKFSKKGWRANNVSFQTDEGANGIQSKLDSLDRALLDENTLNKNIARLQELITLCESLKVKLYLIIPPYSSYYFDISKGKYNKLISFYLEKHITSDAVKIIKSNDFMSTDLAYYENSDHLNVKGALLFTQKIDSILKLQE